MNSKPNDIDFLQAMSDVVPLCSDDKTVQACNKSPTLAQNLKRQAIENELAKDINPLSLILVESVDPHDFIAYKKDGVQDGVFKQLRLGKYPIEQKLNIQSCSPELAKDKLFEFITRCFIQGVRTVLIQHGKGLNAKPEPGLIKSLTNQWLNQLPQILAFHTALKQHGGTSAVYVFLKKNQQQKKENRELHRKK